MMWGSCRLMSFLRLFVIKALFCLRHALEQFDRDRHHVFSMWLLLDEGRMLESLVWPAFWWLL